MRFIFCYQCKKKVEVSYKIGFREECLHCQADLHICRNCRFYDPSAYRECKEPCAERVSDKEKNNYCEYFEPQTKHSNNKELSEKSAHLKAAEALFKSES